MDLKICWFSVCMTFLLLCSFSCEQSEEPFDTQYLPNGVTKSDYQHFTPTPKKVSSPKVHPPHWWVNMNLDTLQILIHDTQIKYSRVHISNSGIELLSIDTVTNDNYLFLNVSIKDTISPGSYSIHLGNQYATKEYSFEVKSRNNESEFIHPIRNTDRLYLVYPDRFANGDQGNDSFEDLKQKGVDRSKMYFRHGGDLEGVIDHLDYIKNLGFNAIWLNPVTTSDQAYSSYHGYAATDHYEVDPRFGGNETYKTLSSTAQSKGVKLIMDVVPNHVGDQHWFIQDIPSEDWIHQFGEYRGSNHKHESIFDSLALKDKKELFLQGWFDYSMPDLNQNNPFLSKYLIQNSIWWIEEMGIDGYRVDTYGYSYPSFMAKWSNAIKKEYPDFHIFGEVWVNSVELQSKYSKPHRETKFVDPKLDGITDFQLNRAIISSLLNHPDSLGGIQSIYKVLAQDSFYSDPTRNVIFLDNHDMDRFFSVVNEDIVLFKSGLTMLYGLRGIPCIYYGTEILHKNFKDPDGLVRSDFEGGWKEDKQNKFLKTGRSNRENEIFDHIKKLNHIRNDYPAINTENGVQNLIAKGIYSISYPSKNRWIMLVYNQNNNKVQVPLHNSKLEGLDLLSGKTIVTSLELKAKEATIITWENNQN